MTILYLFSWAIDQGIGYWSRFKRLNYQEIGIRSLKIAKEINECIDWGRDENELDPENATSPEPNELPISDLTHSLYFLLLTFMSNSPIPIYNSAFYFQSFTSSPLILAFTFLLFTFPPFYFLQLSTQILNSLN